MRNAGDERNKRVNNFDVLKKMCADNKNIMMSPDLLRADKVKAGTQVTFGIGGDVAGAIASGDLVGCVILWNKAQFNAVKKELEEQQT